MLVLGFALWGCSREDARTPVKNQKVGPYAAIDWSTDDVEPPLPPERETQPPRREAETPQGVSEEDLTRSSPTGAGDGTSGNGRDGQAAGETTNARRPSLPKPPESAAEPVAPADLPPETATGPSGDTAADEEPPLEDSILRGVVQQGLRVTGSMTMRLGKRTRQTPTGPAVVTVPLREVNLMLVNETGLPISLGNNLVVIESTADFSTVAGSLVLLRQPQAPDRYEALNWQDHRSYGVPDFEIRYAEGSRCTQLVGGSNAARRYLNFSDNEDHIWEDLVSESLDGGQTGWLRLTLSQGEWLAGGLRASLQLATPELTVSADHGTERFRMVIDFKKVTRNGMQWMVAGQRAIRVHPGELAALLESSNISLPTRIMAANWLAEEYPQQAREPLARVAGSFRSGQLLTACLRLLIRLKGPGLEPHAFDLLEDNRTPQPIRALAARYLGLVRYGPVLEWLRAKADRNRLGLTRLEIEVLGSFGGPQAAEILIELIEDEKLLENRRPQIAKHLARTNAPQAVGLLEELAVEGHKWALDALVEAGGADKFDFFEALLGQRSRWRWRLDLLRGLRLAGGERAVPFLLEALRAESPPPARDPTKIGKVTKELIALDCAAALPDLIELAHQGSLPALQVLANSAHDSARAALRQIAGDSEGVGLQIALGGLAERWPVESIDAFKAALESPRKEIVVIAIRGLGRSRSRRAMPLLIPLLKAEKIVVSSEAAKAIRQLPGGGHSPKLLEIILATKNVLVVRNLVSALERQGFDDRSAVGRLRDHLLANDQSELLRYQAIRLMRQLRGELAGPRNLHEYLKNSGDWDRQWTEWAEQLL